ncbi:MAG: efflux RND transporter periplasmic adaptor subunit, partial [Anaerolineales bacterium]
MRAFSGPIRYGRWILVGMVGIVALYWFLQRPATSSPYQTAKVERGDLAVTVTGEGSVQAKQSANLFWQVSGVVEKVNIKLGDQVRKDDVLATLERESLPQSILLAEADLAEAQRQLDDLLQTNTPAIQAWIALRNAQEAYDKAKRYYDSLFQPYSYEILTWKTVTFTIPLPTPQTMTRTVPAFKTVHVQEADEKTKADAKADLDLKAAQLEDARRAYERLKEGPDAVQLASLQARIAADQAILNTARITAPFEGIVTQLNIQPGDLVTPGTFALRIDNLSHLYVNVSVSEIDVNQIREGQEAIVTLDGVPGREYRGKIIEVSRVGTLQGQTVKFGVKVEILDPDENVR